LKHVISTEANNPSRGKSGLVNVITITRLTVQTTFLPVQLPFKLFRLTWVQRTFKWCRQLLMDRLTWMQLTFKEVQPTFIQAGGGWCNLLSNGCNLLFKGAGANYFQKGAICFYKTLNYVTTL
jgi:hypothetical protein